MNLRIKGCHVSDRSVRELHSLPCLADLDIGFNEISDRGLVMLMTRLPRLKRLDARHNRVSGTGLGSLLKTETVAPLEEFATTSERLDSGGVLALASRLRPVRLTLSETGLTDDTVELLLNTANMGCLRWLDLSNNSLTDQTAEAIIKSPYLNNLRFLSLQENVISPEMKKALRNKYGPGVCTFSR